MSPERYEGPGGASLERVGPAAFERTIEPGRGRTPAHVHDDLGQTFEMLAGRARWKVGGEWHEGEAGARVDIRPGVVHVDPFSAGGGEPLRMRMTVDPAPEPFVSTYFHTLGTLIATGRTNRHGDMPGLTVIAVLRDTRARSYDARAPRWLQRLAVPALAPLARLLGHRARGAQD